MSVFRETHLYEESFREKQQGILLALSYAGQDCGSLTICILFLLYLKFHVKENKELIK